MSPTKLDTCKFDFICRGANCIILGYCRLGALDDDPKLSGCLSEDPTDGTPYIMSPNTNLSAVRWSECSKKAVTQLFQYVLPLYSTDSL